MKTMALMNPIMIMMFSFGSPAGVTLYWVVGGLFGILQQAITNFILKPRIRKQVEEEFKISQCQQLLVKRRTLLQLLQQLLKKRHLTRRETVTPVNNVLDKNRNHLFQMVVFLYRHYVKIPS